MTLEQALKYSSDKLKSSSISYIDYVLFNDQYWSSLCFTITKSYTNFSGQEIFKGSKVKVEFKMQKLRFDSFIHKGDFFVISDYGVQIGGVNYSHLQII